MRKLTEQELKLVQQTMIKKHITSAELLMEIYDHYISHLERFSAEDFDKELIELNKHWTCIYCETLEKELFKNINKSIRRSQWGLIKSFFSWPKLVFTFFLITTITLLANSLEAKLQRMLLVMPPLFFLLALIVFVGATSLLRIRRIKRLFNAIELKIDSTYSRYFVTYLFLPISFFNLGIYTPKLLGTDNFLPEYLSNFSVVSFSFFLYIYSISAYEAWKIKSKTALI
ncbi:hypothetical protein [Algoriphagus sp. AK58]|uniref:hypothetical protein n=1 Tax=Algoriphagus sp. AK58 TaxID=1406877 RepID=UPI00164F3E7E|nr:hypothetical protein [Algoriphagus sp. AK58]MBC6366607.1 hypothetical protein [Algoriphagus sp. AK58]